MRTHWLASVVAIGLTRSAPAQEPHRIEPVVQTEGTSDSTGRGSGVLTSDGRFAVTIEGSTAFLWDCATGRKVRAYQGHANSIRCLAISADDKQLVTGSSDESTILWDLASGKELQTFRETAFKGVVVKEGSVHSVALSADGRHTDDIRDMTLSGDGKRLWTTSTDRSIRLWDVAAGRELCRMHSFNMSDDWLVITADGRFDGTENAWRFISYRDPDTKKLLDDDETRKRFHCPGLLARVWQGEM